MNGDDIWVPTKGDRELLRLLVSPVDQSLSRKIEAHLEVSSKETERLPESAGTKNICPTLA